MEINKWFINFNNFKKDTDDLVWHNTIESFALSLISVFIPIFLFQSNYSLSQVFLYYIIYFLSFAFFSLLSHKFIKLGFKKVLIFRPISLIIFFIWLYSLSSFPDSLNYLAVYSGISSAFYWVIFHCFYSVKTNDNNSMKRTADLFFIPKIPSMLSPIIGALIINILGFNILFFIVSVLLFLSLLPILSIKDFDLDLDFNIKNLINKSNIKYFFSFMVEGIYHSVFLIILPFFIYLNIGKTLDVGFLSFFISLAGILSPIIISKICKNTSAFIKIFSIIEGLLFLLILVISSSFFIFILSFIVGVISNFWLIPYMSRFYTHAKQREGKDALEFITMREFNLGISRALIFIIIYFSNNFNLVFIINSLSRLLLLLF